MVFFNHLNPANDKETNLNFYNFKTEERVTVDHFIYQVSAPIVTWLPNNSGVLYSYDQQTYVYNFKKNKIEKVLMPEGIKLIDIYGWL
jgi:hypothetical protein